MEKWAAIHRAFVVEAFFKNNESYVKTIRAFRKNFKLDGKSAVPSPPTVRLWIKNFHETALANKKKPKGRKRSVRTAETVEGVRKSVQFSPTRSTRKRSANLNITRTSL